MAKLNLGYTKGMNQDLGYDKRSPDQYYDALNIKLINNGSNFCITNTDGEYKQNIGVLCDSVDKGIIGQCRISNGVVLIINGKRISHNIGPETTFNYGYFLVPIIDNNGTVIVCDPSDLFISSSRSTLKETINNTIDSISIIENGKDKIYFTDGNNQLRIITLNKRETTKYPYVEEISDVTPEPVELSFNKNSTSQISDIEIIDGASSLTYGEYQYFVIESTKNGITTNPSVFSNKIIFNKNNVNNSKIKVNIYINNNSNLNIKYVYIYRIKYINDDISIELISKQDIDSNVSNIMVIDDGYDMLQSISLQEFNALFKSINIPKTICTIYNRLILGNYETYSNFKFLNNYDTRTYSWIFDYTNDNVELKNPNYVIGEYMNNSSDMISIINILPEDKYNDINYDVVPKTSSCILNKKKYKLYKEVFTDSNYSVTLGSAGKNIKMKVEQGVEGSTGSFVAGETYRFGIIFYDKYMNRSPVKWMCDYTFPEYNPLKILDPYTGLDNAFNCSLYNVKFELNNESSEYHLLSENNIQYYDICYVNRDSINSNIVDFAICVPGFTNVECVKTNNNPSIVSPKSIVIDNPEQNNYMANCNFVTDNDFTDYKNNNICFPYQIMKDIVPCNLGDSSGNYSIPIYVGTSDNRIVYNQYFYLRGGRLDVDNDYGFDWDCSFNDKYGKGTYSTLYYKKPTKTNISYFYSPLITVGAVRKFTYIKPYTVLKNDEDGEVKSRYYNVTHISGADWKLSSILPLTKTIDGTSTYVSFTGNAPTSTTSIFPFRTGMTDIATTVSDGSKVTGFNMNYIGTFGYDFQPTCSLFCPRSNNSNKWDQTTLDNTNSPKDYGYMSSYFNRQYFIDHNDTRNVNYSMYRSNYIAYDNYLYKPDFVQYESNGDYIYNDNIKISNAGKLADFYPVPWSSSVSGDDSFSEIQYMQLDCNYSNTIAATYNYTFKNAIEYIKDRRKTSGLAVNTNRRYQILFQLRNDVENQYGGNSYYNKISNTYIICTNKIPVTSINNDINYCNGDMKWGEFTIPRVWCNNEGGEDLSIINDKAGILRHNEFVTLVNIPTKIIDKDRGDLFVSNYTDSNNASEYLLGNRFDSFCTSTIKYDDKEVLNISSSIYTNLFAKQNFSIDFNKLIFKYSSTIYASNVKIYNEDIENWAIFPVNEYLDLDATYGNLNKLINHNGKIYSFQDNGIAFVSVQPRVLVDSTDSIDIQLGTGKYFDRYDMLSTNSGISNMNAVCSGYNNLYYIDANRHALFNIMNGNEELSLTKGMFTYFNEHTNIYSRCFYDFKERRVLIFLDKQSNSIYNNSIVYSESLNAFETRLSINPIEIFGINDYLFSYYDPEHDSYDICVHELTNPFNLNQYPFIQFLVNPNNNNYIRYDVVEYTQQNLNNYNVSNVNLFNIKNYYQNATANNNSLNIKNKFSIFRINIPKDIVIKNNIVSKKRIFSPQAFIKLQFDGTNHITSNLNLNFY